jgi:hypothetical protein
VGGVACEAASSRARSDRYAAPRTAQAPGCGRDCFAITAKTVVDSSNYGRAANSSDVRQWLTMPLQHPTMELLSDASMFWYAHKILVEQENSACIDPSIAVNHT